MLKCSFRFKILELKKSDALILILFLSYLVYNLFYFNWNSGLICIYGCVHICVCMKFCEKLLGLKNAYKPNVAQMTAATFCESHCLWAIVQADKWTTSKEIPICS